MPDFSKVSTEIYQCYVTTSQSQRALICSENACCDRLKQVTVLATFIAIFYSLDKTLVDATHHIEYTRILSFLLHEMQSQAI